MLLNVIALITAVSISGVAAYYSIVGLTAIFSGVFLPIIIMGSVLEIGKIVTTVYVHVYWQRLGWVLRIYLSSAVLVLMFITSMGIFGFLSRAHIDATSSIGENTLLITQLDQQIDVERQRIGDSQRVISQMDQAVNNILSQSANERTLQNQRGSQIAAQANQLRSQQRKEREALNISINNSNQRIADLNSQKLKLQQAQAKIEAEVGPIKYIAQLIYGNDVDKDLLEQAVRWVIIIIVAVFDPLAVCLILAITMSMTTRRKEYDEAKQQEIDQKSIRTSTDGPTGTIATQDTSGTTTATDGSQSTATPAASVEPVIQYVDRIIEKPIIEYKTIEVERIVEIEKPVEIIKAIEIEKIVEKPVEVIKEVIKEVRVEDTDRMIELAKEIDNLLGELKNKEAVIGQLKAQIDVLATPNQYLLKSELIGKTLPMAIYTGQIFCRIEAGSISVLKWNGDNWIAIDKLQNNSYLVENDILNGIVILLAEGQISWDNLTEQEQEAIMPLIEDNPRFGRQ